MIKGVNKQIVEINYTKDEFIEKAILIINPQKSRMPQALITQKADRYMQGLLPELKSDKTSILPSSSPKSRRWKPFVGVGILLSSFLGIIAFLLSFLF